MKPILLLSNHTKSILPVPLVVDKLQRGELAAGTDARAAMDPTHCPWGWAARGLQDQDSHPAPLSMSSKDRLSLHPAKQLHAGTLNPWKTLPGMHQQEPPPAQHTAPLQCQHWKLRSFSPQLNPRLWHHWNITGTQCFCSPCTPQAGEVPTQESWNDRIRDAEQKLSCTILGAREPPAQIKRRRGIQA